MKTKISDVSAFKSLFRCITRFTENAHFDVRKKGIRIRSIDPYDFCYIDIQLTPQFFEGYNLDTAFTFGVNIAKLKNILPNITKDTPLLLEINHGKLQFHLMNKRKTTYNLDWLPIDPYNHPEPLKLNYETHIDVPSKEFLSLIKEAATVSNEIDFLAGNGKLKVTSIDDGFSYTSEICVRKGILKVQPIRLFVIIDYLRRLYEIIDICESVKLSMGNEMPLKVNVSYNNKGSFSFVLSNRKVNENRENKNSMLIPDVSFTKLPEFLGFISKREETDPRIIPLSQVETENNENLGLAITLGLVILTRKSISLTKEGERLVHLLKESPEVAKKELHTIALKRMPSYEAIIKSIGGKSLSTIEIYNKVNSALKSKYIPQIRKHDMMMLLGIATWCKAIDRKMALHYFGKGATSVV
jgi:hypothetical protein